MKFYVFLVLFVLTFVCFAKTSSKYHHKKHSAKLRNKNTKKQVDLEHYGQGSPVDVGTIDLDSLKKEEASESAVQQVENDINHLDNYGENDPGWEENEGEHGPGEENNNE